MKNTRVILSIVKQLMTDEDYKKIAPLLLESPFLRRNGSSNGRFQFQMEKRMIANIFHTVNRGKLLLILSLFHLDIFCKVYDARRRPFYEKEDPITTAIIMAGHHPICDFCRSGLHDYRLITIN
jgi:hypothetical protein